MTNLETAKRRLRLVELLSKYPTRAEFVRQFDLNDSYLHQLITGKAPFGEKAARNLEEKIGLDRLYFDNEAGNDTQPYPGKGASTTALRLAERAAEIAQYGLISDEKAQMALDLLNALAEKK